MKRVIRIGDQSSHGGVVVSGAAKTVLFGKAVALLGDKVSCPIPGHGVCPIVEGDSNWLVDGKPVALEGHKTSCGAALISSMPELGRSYEGGGEATSSSSSSSPSAMAALAVIPLMASTLKQNPDHLFDEQFVIKDATGKPLPDYVSCSIKA